MLATILSPVIASYDLGGSIFSFAFPMLLFIIVALTLYAVFSKTSEVPGHKPAAAAPPEDGRDAAPPVAGGGSAPKRS